LPNGNYGQKRFWSNIWPTRFFPKVGIFPVNYIRKSCAAIQMTYHLWKFPLRCCSHDILLIITKCFYLVYDGSGGYFLSATFLLCFAQIRIFKRLARRRSRICKFLFVVISANLCNLFFILDSRKIPLWIYSSYNGDCILDCGLGRRSQNIFRNGRPNFGHEFDDRFSIMLLRLHLPSKPKV